MRVELLFSAARPKIALKRSGTSTEINITKKKDKKKTDISIGNSVLNENSINRRFKFYF